MKQILDLMVDIETLSTNRDKGVVLSVGIQSFSLTELPPMEDYSLYVTIHPHTSVAVGRIKDPDTVSWWHQPKMQAAYMRILAQIRYAHYLVDGQALGLGEPHSIRKRTPQCLGGLQGTDRAATKCLGIP